MREREVENLLMDTSFININKFWKFTGCYGEVENNKLSIRTMGSNIFSLNQDIILPKKTIKLYFRTKLTSKTFIKNVWVGIKVNDILYVKEYENFTINTNRLLSVIVDIKNHSWDDTVQVCVMVESEYAINEVVISEPLLIDLVGSKLSTKMKCDLDKAITYRKGLTFDNESSIGDLSSLKYGSYYWQIKKAKEDSVEHLKNNEVLITTNKNLTIQQKDIKLVKDHEYVIKIAVKNVSGLGDLRIGFNNEALEIKLTDNLEQYYLKAVAKSLNNLTFEFTNDEKIPLVFHIKDILLVDMTKHKIEEKDIIRLPYTKVV